ncbi:anhydro-N-acetylmuramic acid kinase [Telmatobacter bradus]|uniref:anhydro-N-acetylmuramic acid kinase n=1 Tax=Telmatobacter bradus TaxID=474953 RepID=UPI003B437240
MSSAKKKNELVVAGVMSGTSADGVDVAICRIADADKRPTLELLAHEGFRYPKALRLAVLAAMNAESTTTAELARLNWRLALEYAEAVRKTSAKHKLKLDLVGCHGQTLYHQAAPSIYAGKRFACTWQLGEPAVLAQALQTPVVANFRPADMAAGGQGAPLVPLLDFVLFADARRGRVLQNIGGIANFTALPPAAKADQVLAFDSGPGNMVMDWLASELYQKPYDPHGQCAALGNVLQPVLRAELRNTYFRQKPPRTTGREQFGREFSARFLSACRKLSRKPEDALATACALTAETIASAYETYAHPRMKGRPVDYIVSGGGARNRTLMQMLEARLAPLHCSLDTSEHFGLPAEAKEAAAFALLAWQTWQHRPGNVPSATGAARPVLLGQVAYV